MKYERDFEDEKCQVLASILKWYSLSEEDQQNHPLNLDGFESAIAIKNNQRAIVHENIAFKELVLQGTSVVGTTLDRSLPPHVSRIAAQTDRVLIEGAESVQTEFSCRCRDEKSRKIVVYKRRLDEIPDPKYSLLIIGRSLGFVDTPSVQQRHSLCELLSLLQQLDPIDLAICRNYAMGESTKDIATIVGLTPRTVENHRQKIMDLFGFSRPIEIVKMLVRLEENGMIELQI